MEGRAGSHRAALRKVREGVLFGALVPAGMLREEAPTLAAVRAPFVFHGFREVDQLLAGPIEAAVGRELADNGLVFGAWAEAGFHQLAGVRRPVHGPEDLRGARTWARGGDAWWNLLGARPLALPAGQVGAALRQRRVDAYGDALWRIVYAGWHRRTRHVTLVAYRYEPMLLVFNRERFDSLAASRRDILRQQGRMAAALGRRLVRALSADLRRILESSGVTVHVPTARDRRAFAAATESVRRDLAATAGPEARDLLLRRAGSAAVSPAGQ